MKLEQSFEVHAPIDTVWVALNDLERVAPCLPGAAITGHDDDGTYHGEFKVKLGPTTAAYKGTIKIENADEATHTATLAAKGTDKRGQGGANATIVNTLHEIDGGTPVDAVTDFAITGRLARFGRGGMIQDISNRLLRDFATCLATRLGAHPLTMSGLAGLGDLVLTCTGDLSRNRQVGLAMARGESLSEAIRRLGQVAEGVDTARSASALGAAAGVPMPITDAVAAVLHAGKPVRDAMAEILSRDVRAERD